MKQKIQSLADYLIDRLHGSGIDADWKQSQSKNFLNLHNSFHCLDQNGFYEGWQDFTVKLPLNGLVNDFRLVFNGTQYLSIKHQLRYYLEDMITLAIDDYLLKCKDSVNIQITCEYEGQFHSTNYYTLNPGEYIRYYFIQQKDFKGKIVKFELKY